MEALDSLCVLAKSINQSWEECERVDWSEAEQLIRKCRETDAATLAQLPEITEIMAYADENEDWDSEEVASWPDLILAAIERVRGN